MSTGSHQDTELRPGLSAEVEITVSENETAMHLGSGLVPVYATPALVALMEHAAVRALEGHLAPGYSSVGGQIDLRHLAATPIGMRVRAHAELTEALGRKLVFRVHAWDEVEQIGEASHVRFIIAEEAFMTKVNAKGK
jgi:fluoroacetyl-CoA thioesterase